MHKSQREEKRLRERWGHEELEEEGCLKQFTQLDKHCDGKSRRPEKKMRETDAALPNNILKAKSPRVSSLVTGRVIRFGNSSQNCLC